jgi:hypothetical protein
MAAKLTRLTHKIAIKLHLVAESCTICSSRSRWPVRKRLHTPSYMARQFQKVGQPCALCAINMHYHYIITFLKYLSYASL